MNKKLKENYLKQLMWDYNISPEDMEKLLSGEVDRVAHYNREGLLKKMLESFPWFVVVQMWGVTNIRKILTKEVIAKLRTPELRNKYTYVRKRLQEIVSASG